MLRSLSSLSAVFVLSSCAVAPAGGGAAASVLEVAVFRVKDPAAAERLRAAAHERIATYAGFVHLLSLCALDDPGLFADVVEWRSLADAHAAMARAEQDPAVLPFFGALGPIVSMGHYPLTANAVPKLLGLLASAPVVEIAAYGVKDVHVHDAAQPALHAALRVLPVVVGNAPLKSLEAGDYVDLIGWQTRQAHEAANAQMQHDPQAAAFMANVGAMKVFALFRVAGSTAAR
jgi:hypothetical protein